MYHDAFDGTVDSLLAPAQTCFAIVPSDSSDLPQATKAIYVGTEGTIVLRSVNGTADVTFVNVAAGSILDVRTRAVRATGTTAANLVGLA